MYISCERCRSDIKVKFKAASRWQIEERLGIDGRVYAECLSCGCRKDYAIRNIRAREGRIIPVTMIIMMLTIILLLFIFVPIAINRTTLYVIMTIPGVVSVPYIIGTAIIKHERDKVRLFNSPTINSTGKNRASNIKRRFD